MIRQIATDSGTSAQLLRAHNKRTFNTHTEDLAYSRTYDVDELIADHAHELADEQRRLREERLRAMRAVVDGGMHRPSDVPSQLVGDTIRIPSIGMLQPVPIGSGYVLRPSAPPQTTRSPFQG